MKHLLLLPALLLGAPANAAVVRFDFVSEVSVYNEDPDSICVDEWSNRDEAFCRSLANPIIGGITLEVDDPDAIDFAVEWSEFEGIALEDATPLRGSGRVLSTESRSGDISTGGWLVTEIAVKSKAGNGYDISMYLIGDWFFGFGNTGAGWGDAGGGGDFYSARGYWTATVVEPAPIPLPASGLLMLGLLPIAASLRLLKRRNRAA